MQWKDLFYFSQGERRALSLLLFLLILLFIFRLWNEHAIPSQPENTFIIEKKTEPADSSETPKQPVKGNEYKPATSVKTSRPSKPKEQKTNQRNYTSIYPKTEKLSPGTSVELNSADTTLLKKVPGIGSVFANRIIKYRNLLGGFYTVEQLQEVYGIDNDKCKDLAGWFTADPMLIQKIEINHLPEETLGKHPYLNYKQTKIIKQLVHQKGRINDWEEIKLLEEFTEQDKERLLPYLDFR